MTELNASEVLDSVNALEADYGIFRGEREDRIKQYALRSMPQLPKNFARDAQVNIMTPNLINAVKVVRSDLLTFPTEITVVPMADGGRGEVTAAHKRKADTLEKAHAIGWTMLNPNRQLDRNVIWRQLIEPCAVVVLEACAIEQPPIDGNTYDCFPFRAFDIDLDTAGWTQREGVPTRFGRRYKQLADEAQGTYRRKDGPKGRDHVPVKKGGKVQWEPVSDDYSPRTSLGNNGRFEEMEIAWFDNGREIYHVGIHDTHRWQIGPVGFGPMKKSEGEVLWCGPNPFGRVSAFVIEADDTPQARPEDKHQPWFLDAMVNDAQITLVRTFRATRSRNIAAPRQYINVDPEVGRMWATRGGFPDPHEWAEGKVPFLPGPVLNASIEEDPDLDKLEERLEADRERFGPKALEPLDQETLRTATASGIVSAIGQAVRYVSPLVGAWDIGKRQIFEAIEHAASYYGDYYNFRLQAGEADYVRSKNLKEGELVTIDRDLIDFPHRIRVNTHSMTPAQRQAQIDIAKSNMEMNPDGSPGIGTREDLMEAAGITDPTAQNMQKLKEMIVIRGDPMVQQLIDTAARAKLQLELGIDFALAAALTGGGVQQPVDPSAPQTAAPPAAPSFGQTVREPTIDPVTGGGSPNVNQTAGGPQ
jgi:hypothetical protein